MPQTSFAIRRTRHVAGLASLIVFLALLTPACAWKKEVEEERAKGQQLLEEKKKLEQQVAVVGAESTEMKTTLDEVQKSLEDLRSKELKVLKSSIEVVEEGKPRSTRREELRQELESLRKAVRINLAKLAHMEKERKASQAKIAGLEGRVTALDQLAAELRKTLEQKEATIAALEEKVLHLTQTVETQAGEIKEKETVIDTQTKELNKAYVAIAPKKLLKEKGMIEKKGSVLGLGGGWLRTGKFDPEVFREIDITKESEFPVTASVKDAKVLSDHPKESYELLATGPKASTLKVKDPVAFWKGSKYLIVLVPD